MTTTAELNSELNVPNKIPKEQMQDQQILPPLRNLTKPNNNNKRHLVTFGIIIVLFTLYITAAAIRHSKYTKHIDIEDHEDQDILRNLQEKENQRQVKIIEKLQEHEHICSELEIFIKEFKWSEKLTDEPSKSKETKRNPKTANDKDTKNNTTTRTSNKNLEENKKEQAKKKNSTAEPIIYLFALVFIYLLLKAASDINQHYKSQAKGDKRLRRCSLQSYAQTHKQDRRASKDKPLIAIAQQKKHFLEQRSQSFDRPTKLKSENLIQKFDFNVSLKKNSSIALTGNIVDRKVINVSDILISDSQSRRCSAPGSPKNLSSDMNRRTSIGYGSNTGVNSLAGSIENVDLQFPENKRRVRMINRH